MSNNFSKIDSFAKEIHKSDLIKDLRMQIFKLRDIYEEIIHYLKNDVEPTDKDSRLIHMIIADFNYINRKKITYQFHKNKDKMIDEMQKNIQDAKKMLLNTLERLQSYINTKEIFEIKNQ